MKVSADDARLRGNERDARIRQRFSGSSRLPHSRCARSRSHRRRDMLLPVIRQNLGAGLAQARAVLFQAGQDDLVTLIHMRPAQSRDVARAPGIGPAALREPRRNNEEQGK